MEILAKTSRYPQCLIRAANEQLYRPNPELLRVSELVDSPLIKFLMLKHWEQCSSSIENSLPALMGTAWHQFLEQYADPDHYLIEQELRTEKDGTLVKGTMDLYNKEEQQVEDHKSTSAIKLLKGETEDWTCRMNTYAWLCETNGIPVKSLLIWAFIKDWSKYKMMQSPDYPRRRLIPIKLELWPMEKREQYVQHRIALHKAPPVECSLKEKWAKASTWALKKEGRKSAVKVEDSRNTLLAYMREKSISLGGEYSIEERPGEFTRCQDWCLVSDFCPYNKAQQEKAA